STGNAMAESKKKVLIIEDDEHVSHAYSIKLGMEGFDTVIADDGDLGVAKAGSEHPDLIMLDIMLPKKNGFEVLEAIKKDPATKSIPVIVLSNLGQQSDIEKAQSLGAAEYLTKIDHSIKDIVDRVKGHLGV
ncbi:MAG TPA: response regulator, partial [Candidatus Paceibacterota bacterium]